MSRPNGRKLVHLFNCDRTYKLDAVEGLLNAAKLDFEPVVEKHYFSLSQMSEMSENIESAKLQIDMAFFVVHAHESRLSINEDNAGIGYAKIYRALLTATAKKVIIVIGGDDNYKNTDEEDRSVISRWAWRKISSQFSEEFLDGRKSFIFSWNKEHRPIHEAALIHYFDSSKKEPKFNYQPEPKQVQSSDSAQTPSQKTNQAIDLPTGGDVPKSGPYSAEKNKPYRPSQPNISSNSAASSSSNVIGPIVPNTPPEEMLAKPKDLAILGCNVSENSMETVMQVFEEIAPKLNLAEHPLVGNLPVDEVKNYLTKNRLKFCVLVVDAQTVKDAYESQLQQQYEELLATAADEVVEKVIVLLRESRFSSAKEKVIDRIISIVDGIITREKGFIAKLENGKLSVDPDVLVQLIVPASVASHRNPRKDPLGGFTNSSMDLDPPQGDQMRNPSELQPRYGCNETRIQQEQGVTTIPRGSATSFTGHLTANGELVMLKSQLRSGKISCLPGDLEISFPGFQVPDDITQRLLHEHGDTIQAGVKIVRDKNGEIRVTVEQKSKDSSREEVIQIADNETLLLDTCVRFGKISLEEGDLRYMYPDWKIPAYITASLAREYGTLRKGYLYVVSDEKEIRFKVEFGRGQKLLDSATKTWRRFTHYKS